MGRKEFLAAHYSFNVYNTLSKEAHGEKCIGGAMDNSSVRAADQEKSVDPQPEPSSAS